MKVDKEGLWYRVLKARYGEVGGCIVEGGRNVSRWWRMICNVREGRGWMLVDGLITILGGWWEMGGKLSFGMIIGWVEFLLIFVSADCMTYQ